MEDKSQGLPFPGYFSMEPFRQEEFLAGVGSFNQVQFQLFHNLCSFWQPVLDYNQFLLKTSKPELSANNQLELLMKKLKAARIGLLQYALEDDKLRAIRIILTEQDSQTFYYYLCEDLLARQLYNHNNPFLSAKAFKDEELPLPPFMIKSLENDMLSPGYQKKHKEGQILGISGRSRYPLLIPSAMMEEYTTALRSYIRSEMASLTLMENFSRIAEQKISVLQKNLSSTTPEYWLIICNKLLEHQDALKLRIKGINKLIFISAQLLQTWFSNSLEEIKAEQEEEKKKQKARVEIVEEFRLAGAQWSSMEHLEELLKEREEQWSGFTEDFKASVLERADSKEQPELLLVNKNVIHRDYIFRYFTREINMLHTELRIYYRENMKEVLRNKRSKYGACFFSRRNLQNDIMEQIQERDLQLWALMQRPKLLAEGAIHYIQNMKGIKSTQKLKDALSIYFSPDLNSLKPIDTVMQIQRLDLFQQSWVELSWWRRLIMKLTGRYDSYVETFSGHTDASTREKKDRKTKNREHRDKKGQSPLKTSSGKKPSEKAQSSSPATHTIRAKKKAWAEFDDLVTRKD